MYHELLKEFRTKNTLTEYKMQTTIFIKSELKEVLTASNMDFRVEEMCDVCILCVNAIEQLGGGVDYDCVLFGDASNKSIAFAVRDCQAFVRAIESEPKKCYFLNILVIMYECIVANGYDFELSMVETAKKILSREGAINQVTQKWEKFEYQNDVYAPNYSTCKK